MCSESLCNGPSAISTQIQELGAAGAAGGGGGGGGFFGLRNAINGAGGAKPWVTQPAYVAAAVFSFWAIGRKITIL